MEALKSARPLPISGQRYRDGDKAMAAHTSHTNGLEAGAQAAPQGPAAELRYVARQPILDAAGHVHAYDLHFRNAPETLFRRDAEVAIETMLDNEVLFGLERLSNGIPAFVSCTAEALIDDLVLVLTPSQTVLGVPSNLEPNSRLVDACRTLKARGFRLALDDFTWHEALRPLLDRADYIRMDFRKFGASEKQQLGQRSLDQRGKDSITLVAQKVETQDDLRQARAMGFTLFQGDYLCHPVLLKKRKVPSNRMYHFEIVRELYRDPLDVRKVSQLVRSDAALMYRLLRLANSPIYGLYQEVRSIETAIRFLGEIAFRRVVSVAVLSELNSEQPAEILQMGLLRGRFCELAARIFRQDPAEQYLVGIFSLLPAMLGVPMDEIVANLPFRTEIGLALTGTANPERAPLAWLEFHERRDWQACDQLVSDFGGDSRPLAQAYEEALIWAAAASPGAA
jgi:EAL and modified HD-GYP domain-containing signal transduction protein